MINHIPDINIPQSDPFIADKLKRKQAILNFEKMVSLYGDSGCVVAINGDWGSGKTTFVKMMVQDMKNKGYHPLYFNAWENDNLQDSLIPIISQLQDILPESNSLAQVIDCGAKIVVDISKDILSSLIQKQFGVDLKQITTDVKDNISAPFEQELNLHKEQTKSFAAFKNALQDYVNEITTDTTKPVVFFVDELDRCNPHFAMNVLERIKHLFEIPHIVFVLSINRPQLENSISGYFGSDKLDSVRYLNRFIDVEYMLPEVDKRDFIDYLWDSYHFEELSKTYSRRFSEDLRRDWDDWRFGLYVIAFSQFDLRTIDRVIANTRLALETYPEDHYIHPDVLMLLYYIKYLDRNLYNSIVQRTIELEVLAQEVYDLLKQPLAAMEIQHLEVGKYTYTFSKFCCMYFMYSNNQYTCKLEDFQKVITAVKLYKIDEAFDWYTNTGHRNLCSLQPVLEHIELIQGFEQKEK